MGAHAPSVDYATGRTTFSLTDPEKLQEVIRSIDRLGYNVSEGSKRISPPSRLNRLHIETLISFCLSVPLLCAMFFEHSVFHNAWLQWALATPVFVIGILHFGSSGLRSLRAGVANMDVLISVGICAGYISSVVSLLLNLGHETIFFEATSSIVTFVLIGHLLEERAVRKTTSAIENLAMLRPRTAVRIATSPEAAGTTALRAPETVPIEEIIVGDLVQVNNGDTVPTDGIIENGSLLCDETMLSGESIPVEKLTGSSVIGGSIVVDGSASIRTTAVGDQTILASIVKLVQDAQQRKPSIQRVGDAVSAVFVPAVVLISVVVLSAGLLFWNLTPAQALVRALAIAVVACPCAMGLATPTAIMVALGKAATSGILIRGGDTLERLAAIQGIAFDKTGTLTTGELRVRSLTTHSTVEVDDARGIISALQRHSSHPIAKALLREFSGSTSPCSFTSAKETRGIGIEALGSDGALYTCGGVRVKERFGIESHDDLVLVRDGTLIASLELEDAVRPEALQVLDRLRELSLSLAIISGDSARHVDGVADTLRISERHSQKLPHEKLEIVRLRQKDGPLAYVGDGINDAPTLAEASVGISLGSASDVAVNSAQVILSGNSLQNLPATIRLARLTVRTIKQNLFWAFLYNVIAIPLAACGYIAPLTGALLMTLSDVVIVSNSLRIKLFRVSE